MRIPTKSFWKGFALGSLLFGGAGAFLLNHHIRFMHGVNSFHGADHVFSWVSLMIQQGHLDKAESRLRARAFHHHQNARYNVCMNKVPYHLWFSRARERCLPILESKMPADWADPWKQQHMINEEGTLVPIENNSENP